jgi:hypothetical protein
VHDIAPVVGLVEQEFAPGFCVQLATVRYGPVALLTGFEVDGLLQVYFAVTDWFRLYVVKVGELIEIPGQISPGVSYVATQQEPVPELPPLVVALSIKKLLIWLLWNSGPLAGSVHGAVAMPPKPLSQPGNGFKGPRIPG